MEEMVKDEMREDLQYSVFPVTMKLRMSCASQKKWVDTRKTKANALWSMHTLKQAVRNTFFNCLEKISFA